MADDDSNQIQKIDLDKVDWKSSREFFESLGEELDKLDNKDEAYDFTWVGKRKAVIEAGAPINKTLRPNVDESKDWETTENLFIEGDNLDALKLLQESYLGKVKMIYIDPPYNTGKDFVYHDDFKANTEDYDEDTEYKDASGNIQFKKNEKSNGRYHSDWLSMMYPRLKLARNLLSDDGVMFISIDDIESSNLRKLCDEIFGEDNFIAQIVWKSRPGNDARAKTGVSTDHEYLLTYAKSIYDFEPFLGVEKDLTKFSNPDNDPRGPWRSADLTGLASIDARPNLHYPITNPDDGAVYPPGPSGWAYEKSKMQQKIEDGRVLWPSKPDGRPRHKLFMNEMSTLKTFPSIVTEINTGHGSKEIKQLFDTKVFDFPKPSKFISMMAEQTTRDNDIVLDIFSGSGTTAQAIMQLNSEDGGCRRHIQVQLPEETDEKSEARKAGYKTIPEIARERIRRAGEKIKEEYKDELAKREKPLDVGFRTLIVADTNYREVFKSAGQHTQESLLDTIDNVKEDRSELDLLYGVLVQSALELNRPIEKKELSGADVYVYDYFSEVSGLVACFADSVPEETIKEIAKLKPLTAVFKDSSFESSQDKVNLAEHFRIISPDTKVKVV